jgi:hypothetical protein
MSSEHHLASELRSLQSRLALCPGTNDRGSSTGETRRLHLSSRNQIERRQNVGCDKRKQANSCEFENGPKSRSHLPIVAVTLGNRGSNACDRGLQQRGGDGETDKIQPRNFTDAHRCCILSREVCQLTRTADHTFQPQAHPGLHIFDGAIQCSKRKQDRLPRGYPTSSIFRDEVPP